MNKRCLIIGGGGFIGSHLAESLVLQGYLVRVFDIRNFDRKNLSAVINKIEIFEGDFHNPIDVSTALINIDYVYHLVSSTIPSNSVLNPTYDIETNVVPSLRLLQLCVELNIKKIIFISSGGTVYGIPNHLPISESHPSNPINSYGISKRTIESYIILYNKLWGLDACIFRLSNPYGEHQNPLGKQGVIPIFIYKALKSEKITIWGDGRVIRDYIYIKDVIKILVKSIEIKTPELIYNLGSGVGTSISDILLFIRENVNKNVNINYQHSRNFDVPVNILDTSLLTERFGAGNVLDIQTGLQIMTNYLREKIWF